MLSSEGCSLIMLQLDFQENYMSITHQEITYLGVLFRSKDRLV